MAKQTQQLVLMLVIGVLIGSAAVMTWKKSSDGANEDALSLSDSGATTSMEHITSIPDSLSHASELPLAPEIPEHSRVGLSVTDQSAGKPIHVSGFTVTQNQWMAVYEDQDGKPGWILGAARVHPGDSEVDVELLRPTQPKTKYYVAILNDDGSDSFNRMTDLPPLSPDKVVIVSFTTTE